MRPFPSRVVFLLPFNMLQYVIRRFLLAIPVIFGILIVTFTIARLIPGDPCRSALGEHATEAACTAFAARMGLDQPILIQLGIYVQDILLQKAVPATVQKFPNRGGPEGGRLHP